MALSRRRKIPKTEAAPNPVEVSAKSWEDDINSADTERRLHSLFQIATRPLSLLSEAQYSDLAALRQLARVTYNTPTYAVLHAKITGVFGTATYQPLTVGSFFVGCLTSSNLRDVAGEHVNAGCALHCSADSIPPPPNDGGSKWGFCSQNVVWCVLSTSVVARNTRRAFGTWGKDTGPLIEADYSGVSSSAETFDFIYMTRIPSSSKAILFVEYPDYTTFPGFTRHEKARLIHRMHITDVKLLSYDDASQYKDILPGDVGVAKVRDLKSRADIRDDETPQARQARRSDITLSKQRQTSQLANTAPDTLSSILAFALLCAVILGFFGSLTIRSLRRGIASKAGRL